MIKKEYIVILVSFLYLAYLSYKNWGKKFRYEGIDERAYRKNILADPIRREEKCRRIFENFFNTSFFKCRPDFLKNPQTGRNLELDGFCPSIPTKNGWGVAFEYNGPQHYHFTPKFHESIEAFQQQQERDRKKYEMCINSGVTLIRIPYDVKDLETFIRKQIYHNDLYFFTKP